MHFHLSGRDVRFAPEAYGFILSSLDFERTRSAIEGHMKANVVVKAVCDLAVLKFGPLAESVLRSWGVTETRNVGEIVYNLIDMEILTKTDDDSFDEFFGVESLPELLNRTSSYTGDRAKLTRFHDS